MCCKTKDLIIVSTQVCILRGAGIPKFRLFHIFPKEIQRSVFCAAGEKMAFTERAQLVLVIKTFLAFLFLCHRVIHSDISPTEGVRSLRWSCCYESACECLMLHACSACNGK